METNSVASSREALKEDAFKLAQQLLSNDGLKLKKFTSREGIKYSVKLRLYNFQDHIEVSWHESDEDGERLAGWNVASLKSATKGFKASEEELPYRNALFQCTQSHIFSLVWPELSISFEAGSEAERDALVCCFQQLAAELEIFGADLLNDMESLSIREAEKEGEQGIGEEEGGIAAARSPGKAAAIATVSSEVMNEFSKAHSNVLKVQEHAMDEMITLRWVYSFKLMDRFVLQKRNADLSSGWRLWTRHIQAANRRKMEGDRRQWHLHARASSGADLHAWYHSVFCAEVYRLQGPFWFKPAKLGVYKCTNTPVGGAPLTPMEKAILASVMCTKGTTYVDVAVQMYTVQAVLSEAEFQLYQKLTSGEVELVKHAARAKPARKRFRLSFVSGALYLTWEDRNGYKGIGLHEVLTLVAGNRSEDGGDLYLSLLLPDRALDLSFDTADQRRMWQGFLNTLVLKERGDAFDIRADFKYG